MLLNPSVRENRPVKAYLKWANRIPGTYAKEVLEKTGRPQSVDNDQNRLAMLKHFKSLMPMAKDARKPMFHLTAADGANLAGTPKPSQDSKRQFRDLAKAIVHDISTN